MQNTLRILGVLLDYPQAELLAHTADMKVLLQEEGALPWPQLQSICNCLDQMAQTELLSLQEDYVASFDRGRSLSLHLFEHVHGESRDRGQAMVDLRMAYHQAGLELAANQLPDYLPVFVEYCAHLAPAAARQWLVDVAHILRLLLARLQQRESAYATLISCLLVLAGEDLVDPETQTQVASEPRDDTPEKLDAAWAEKPVTFGCATAACAPVAAGTTTQAAAAARP